ncbi:MAG: sugar phosphate isomerase/epimerase family protein [Lachnospiraceae bacterium]|nr:sugar phosphate isomerase/epimerase family protein [Lachnospiraceae bacterium]
MIQFGMRVHDLCPKGPLLGVLDAIHDADIRNVQLAFGKSVSDYDLTPGHYSAGLGNYIRRELDSRDIHIAVLGCYINPANPDETAREASVAKFIEHLKYARRIGADMVGTETGRFSADFKVTPLTKTEECYQTVLASFRKIVRAAEQLGVTVGVEGVFDHTIHSPELMARFLDDIDSEAVEVILDAVNLMTPDVEFSPEGQEAILDRAFALYGDRISVLHLKDFVFDGQKQLYRHPGEGHFHYEALMKHIRTQKPHIIGLLENSSPDRYADDCAYLRNMISTHSAI